MEHRGYDLRSINQSENGTFFFRPLTHFLMCLRSFLQFILAAAWRIILSLARGLWEAIREKLTQLPASLSRLPPQPAAPPPAPLSSRGDQDSRRIVKKKTTYWHHFSPFGIVNKQAHSKSQTNLSAGSILSRPNWLFFRAPFLWPTKWHCGPSSFHWMFVLMWLWPGQGHKTS